MKKVEQEDIPSIYREITEEFREKYKHIIRLKITSSSLFFKIYFRNLHSILLIAIVSCILLFSSSFVLSNIKNVFFLRFLIPGIIICACIILYLNIKIIERSSLSELNIEEEYLFCGKKRINFEEIDHIRVIFNEDKAFQGINSVYAPQIIGRNNLKMTFFGEIMLNSRSLAFDTTKLLKNIFWTICALNITISETIFPENLPETYLNLIIPSFILQKREN